MADHLLQQRRAVSCVRIRFGDFPPDLRRVRRHASVDVRFVQAQQFGSTLTLPHVRARDARAAGHHERIRQRVRRDFAFVVVGDVSRFQRPSKRVPIGVAAEVRLIGAARGDGVCIIDGGWRAVARPTVTNSVERLMVNPFGGHREDRRAWCVIEDTESAGPRHERILMLVNRRSNSLNPSSCGINPARTMSPLPGPAETSCRPHWSSALARPAVCPASAVPVGKRPRLTPGRRRRGFSHASRSRVSRS